MVPSRALSDYFIVPAGWETWGDGSETCSAFLAEENAKGTKIERAVLSSILTPQPVATRNRASHPARRRRSVAPTLKAGNSSVTNFGQPSGLVKRKHRDLSLKLGLSLNIPCRNIAKPLRAYQYAVDSSNYSYTYNDDSALLQREVLLATPSARMGTLNYWGSARY